MSAKEINGTMSVQEIKAQLAELRKFAKDLPKGKELNETNRTIKGFETALEARKGTRIGRTGDRYSPEQIETAVEMRNNGESWKAIGRALGIRATAYLSKMLVASGEIEAPKPAAKKPAVKKTAAKKTTAKKPAAKTTTKRTVRVRKAVAA